MILLYPLLRILSRITLRPGAAGLPSERSAFFHFTAAIFTVPAIPRLRAFFSLSPIPILFFPQLKQKFNIAVPEPLQPLRLACNTVEPLQVVPDKKCRRALLPSAEHIKASAHSDEDALPCPAVILMDQQLLLRRTERCQYDVRLHFCDPAEHLFLILHIAVRISGQHSAGILFSDLCHESFQHAFLCTEQINRTSFFICIVEQRLTDLHPRDPLLERISELRSSADDSDAVRHDQRLFIHERRVHLRQLPAQHEDLRVGRYDKRLLPAGDPLLQYIEKFLLRAFIYFVIIGSHSDSHL